MILWQKKYEIGIEKIDLEHQLFLGLMSDYSNQLVSNPDPKLIVNRICEIQKYAEFHFLSEENIMEEFNYPSRTDHRDLHQALLNQVALHLKNIKSDKMSPQAFGDFLLGWFVGHIMQEDILIAQWLKLGRPR